MIGNHTSITVVIVTTELMHCSRSHAATYSVKLVTVSISKFEYSG